jgi:hypothetical protein
MAYRQSTILTDGSVFGEGPIVPVPDPRVTLLNEAYPLAGKLIAEPGCWEGQVSLSLAHYKAIVFPSDVRGVNVEITKQRLDAHRVNAIDPAILDIRYIGRFKPYDAIACFGLLYHLADPIVALARCAEACDTLLLDTHVAVTGKQTGSERLDYDETQVIRMHDLGWVVKHYYEINPEEDMSGGIDHTSVWLTERSLLSALHWAGYRQVEVVSRDDKNERLLLIAKT